MGTIADKLAYTKQAREEIRQAIVDKGVQCPGDAPFCSFDDYISQISGGGATAPIFEMPLSNNLDYTGTLGCTISVTGEDISFIDNAFSATSYSSIKLEFPKSLDECIITVDFKINSTGTPAYPLYRRLLWAKGKVSGSVYTALRTEVSYSTSASTNYLNFESNNLDTSPLADGNWHTTKGQKPQPFLEEALNNKKQEILELVKESILNG